MPSDAFHPIVYVRGYAMTRGEINETTADPFCGFNLGATVYRATPERNRPPRKYIFESPLVRLASDFGYTDVYDDGHDILDEDWAGKLSRRSIVIHRYYDPASNLLGSGQTPDMESFARGLSRLVAKVRELVCREPENEVTPKTFRCHLVAHSMGGLVCRAFLQNPALDEAGTRKCVDRLFTYATPHNGIELAGVNVPEWLSVNDMNNFNRERMAEYLGLEPVYEKTKRVDWIPEEALPSERVFCLVGTNRGDYGVAHGLSRTFAGNGSDGLVRIEHATLHGLKANGQSVPCAKAFVYRAHSGPFGIVNSEEAYQNLTRFLFGDVRADVWVDVEEVRLPAPVQEAEEQGKTVDALYQLEVLASPRGKLWYLTRRVAEEDSVACLSHAEWRKKGSKKALALYLSSLFLARRARVDAQRPSLAYALTLGIRVPDYEVERKLWINEHYEGGYLFRDTVVIELVPPQEEAGAHGLPVTNDWLVKYDWQSDRLGQASTVLPTKQLKSGKIELSIPFDNELRPGIRGKLRFVVSTWNE